MKTPPSVRQLTLAEFERWDQLTVLAPEGSIYQTTPYLSALCEATGGRFRVLGAFQGDELLGGAALYEESSPWGTVVSPRLLLYYNGLVLRPRESPNPARRASRQLEVQRALEAALRVMSYDRLCLKCRSPLQDLRVFQQNGWKATPTYTYVVPLGEIPALWQRVDQNLRRLVTRCEKEAVTFTEDDDFESFYRMHLDVHQRKGAPLYLQKPQFERYFRQLRSAGLCRLYQARLPSGQSIAAQLVLTGEHPVSHTVCAASDGEFLSMGASAFLRWKSFEALAALGYAANDLTDAALNPVSRFKSQLGADLELCMQIARPDSARLRLRDGLAGVKRLAATLRQLPRRRRSDSPDP
ncbi:MAG TPA: GNAT family N-acetyltransferase [Gemmatimonadales bacterium]|nr:GNAT family N-acetyltransferase [Gemmatimonadales bacterium]